MVRAHPTVPIHLTPIAPVRSWYLGAFACSQVCRAATSALRKAAIKRKKFSVAGPQYSTQGLLKTVGNSAERASATELHTCSVPFLRLLHVSMQWVLRL